MIFKGNGDEKEGGYLGRSKSLSKETKARKQSGIFWG